MAKLKWVYIDLSNSRQVEWWNNIGSKLVRIDIARYDMILEDTGKKTIGYWFVLGGLCTNYVIKKLNRLSKDPY